MASESLESGPPSIKVYRKVLTSRTLALIFYS